MRRRRQYLCIVDRLVPKVRDGLTAVAEWEAEHGPFTDAEVAAARLRVADGPA